MTLSKFDTKVESELIDLTAWKLPIPWEIDIIEPELHFYASGKADPVKAPYTKDPDQLLEDLTSAGYLGKKTSKIIFITHGFENDITTEWLPQMKDEIFKVDPEALVVLLGWGGGANINVLKYAQVLKDASFWLYFEPVDKQCECIPKFYFVQAAANTQTVAKWFREYLSSIRTSFSDGTYIFLCVVKYLLLDLILIYINYSKSEICRYFPLGNRPQLGGSSTWFGRSSIAGF